MGAFGFATGLASILRGQQQGQEASDIYRQKLQARQLEQRLKQMELMARLREGQEAESALTKLPKEAQPYARLGQLGPWMQQQRQRVAKFGTPEKLEALNQVSLINVPSQLKPLLERAKAPGASPALIDLAYKELVPAFGSSLYSERIIAVPDITPEGNTKITWTRVPARTGTGAVPGDGGKTPIAASSTRATSDVVATGMRPLDQKSKDLLRAVNEAETEAKGLRGDYAAVLPKYKAGGARWLLNQWSLYSSTLNPAGLRGKADPDAAQWFSHIGQMKTNLLTAAGGNSRNLKMVNELFGPHVVSELQDPEQLMGRLRAFERGGRFHAIRTAVLGPNIAGSMGAAGGTTADVPPASMIPEGTKRKFSNGKTYQNLNGTISEVAP